MGNTLAIGENENALWEIQKTGFFAICLSLISNGSSAKAFQKENFGMLLHSMYRNKINGLDYLLKAFTIRFVLHKQTLNGPVTSNHSNAGR